MPHNQTEATPELDLYIGGGMRQQQTPQMRQQQTIPVPVPRITQLQIDNLLRFGLRICDESKKTIVSAKNYLRKPTVDGKGLILIAKLSAICSTVGAVFDCLNQIRNRIIDIGINPDTALPFKVKSRLLHTMVECDDEGRAICKVVGFPAGEFRQGRLDHPPFPS